MEHDDQAHILGVPDFQTDPMLEKLVESTEAMFGWSSDSTLGTLGGKQHRQCHLQLTPEDSFIGKSSSTSGLEQLHDATLRR